MTRQIHSTFLSAFVLIAALGAPSTAAAQDAKQPYSAMAPVEQHRMNRNAEVALARSAAPDAISHGASVIVLTRHGYETAAQGKNGWVCWVGRETIVCRGHDPCGLHDDRKHSDLEKRANRRRANWKSINIRGSSPLLSIFPVCDDYK